MRLLEVRDGLIKIESTDKLELSTFLLIDDNLKSYIAQIIQSFNTNIYYAKLLFLYNGSLLDYDNSLPSLNSEIKEFDFTLLARNFDKEEPMLIGNFINKEEPIYINKKDLDKKTLISADSSDINNTIITNIKKQIENVITIDCIGNLNGKKFVAGKDFKLPLNTEALNFIYEDCLNDATTESKAYIKEIFKDLSEYSQSVSFLPFATLKTIIDDMVEKQHIFKLLVLKNKLEKFSKLGYFAVNKNEVDNLEEILSNNDAVIDVSTLDIVFQNRYLNIILSSIEKNHSESQVILQASNSIDKKNLRKALTGKIKTLFITHSRFKYINEIKSLFKNFIIEPNFINNENFKPFAKMLSSMSKESFLIIGESTKRVPLVSLAIEQVFENKEALKDEVLVIDSEDQELESSDPSFAAIKNKSNDLIEQLAEEVQNAEETSNLELFEEEDNSVGATEEIVLEQEDSINDVELEKELDNAPFEIEFENSSETFSEETSEDLIINENIDEYHTCVDSFKATEIEDEISEVVVNNSLDDIMVLSETIEQENIAEKLDNEPEEIEQDLEELTDTDDTNNNETVTLDDSDIVNIEELSDDDNILDIDTQVENISEVQNEEPLMVDNINSDDNLELEEIVEFDDVEIPDDAIIVEMDDIEEIDEYVKEDIDKEIVEDVDKVFTTMKEDSISESDLDFIDELNNNINENTSLEPEYEEIIDFNEGEDDELIMPIEGEITDLVEDAENNHEVLETKNSTTPIIPVYDAEIPAEDLVSSDPIEQGDMVVHAKYGNGVVEKMIKYGAKTLYSINFDNVGRRLLDPTLTEIKKF